MPNALSIGTPPPAPNPQAHSTNDAGNALAAPGQPQQQQPSAPPAPTHQQVVAALRHFDAIETELTTLLKDPDLGKTDQKSAIIDGVTRLVGNGIMTTPEAVNQLSSVPERPFDQKQWLMDQYKNTIQGRVAVLSHHQAAFLGQDVDTTPPDQDNHSNTMAGLMTHYTPVQGNA